MYDVAAESGDDVERSGAPSGASDKTGACDAVRNPADVVRLTAWVHGRVQGVGFRWWTRSRALELGLVGWAANLGDGRVEVVAEGPRSRCEELLRLLAESPPRDPPPGASRSWYRRPGRVAAVTHQWSPAKGAQGFQER
ncbi:MAG TPA: acylphosphatase [Kineosporiaceae bacterium]